MRDYKFVTKVGIVSLHPRDGILSVTSSKHLFCFQCKQRKH